MRKNGPFCNVATDKICIPERTGIAPVCAVSVRKVCGESSGFGIRKEFEELPPLDPRLCSRLESGVRPLELRADNWMGKESAQFLRVAFRMLNRDRLSMSVVSDQTKL